MRSSFVNMCGYAGDITSAKNRIGINTALVMVKGGTENTAIKVVTCSTSDGVFTDYAVLESSGTADLVKGYYIDLTGADKFIKVTGAKYADVVFADCNFDPKAITTTGTVPAPSADLDNNKTATIDVSTYTNPVEITPTAGKDGMKKATVTLSNIPVAGATLYAWKDASNNIAYTETATPEAEGGCYLSATTGLASDTIKAVAEGEITITISEEDVDFTRYSDGDIEL